MTPVLFALTAALYGLTCCVFLVDLAHEHGWRGPIPATQVLVAAVVLHLAYLAAVMLHSGVWGFGNIYQTLNVASFLLAASYLGALVRYRVHVLGGFVLPVILLFFLGAGLGTTTVRVSTELRTALLPFHVGINLLGIVSIGMAFSVSVAYLLQEHLLRRKQIRGLFLRLPALDRLDVLRSWLVAIGFLLLTGGLLSGVLWAVREHRSVPMLSPTQTLGIVSWLVFGAILMLRRVAGWRGRRGAIGTVIGFALTIAVLAGYLLRAGSVG